MNATAAARIGDVNGSTITVGSLTHVGNVNTVTATNFPVLARLQARIEEHELNGQPGAILRDRDDHVAGTMTLDVLDGRIQAIRSVVNPDKLGHLGIVADAWAMTREVKDARRR